MANQVENVPLSSIFFKFLNPTAGSQWAALGLPYLGHTSADRGDSSQCTKKLLLYNGPANTALDKAAVGGWWWGGGAVSLRAAGFVSGDLR